MDLETCLRRLPKKLKIGPYDWRVVLEADGGDKCGETDFEVHTIRLWPSVLTSSNHVVGILLHECLHVIYDNEALEHEERNGGLEEAIVIGFEQGLVSLFRDNPKLLTWMKKCL